MSTFHVLMVYNDVIFTQDLWYDQWHDVVDFIPNTNLNFWILQSRQFVAIKWKLSDHEKISDQKIDEKARLRIDTSWSLLEKFLSF